MRFRNHLKTKRARNGERFYKPNRHCITKPEAFTAPITGNRMVRFVI
jgi:hypothetical protein